MDPISAFLLYALCFRLAVIAAGIVCIVLGFRLFALGVTPGIGADAQAEAGAFKIRLKNAAPGTCFALFGAGLIAAMIVRGSPELTAQSIKEVEEGGLRSGSVQTSVVLKGGGGVPRGPASAFEMLVALAAEREGAGDDDGAIAAYSRALSVGDVSLAQAARPLHGIAGIYEKQERLAEALPLVRLAVQLEPNNAAYLRTLTNVLRKRGLHAEALAAARQGLEIAPGDADLLHSLAVVLAATGDLPGAISRMEEAAHADRRYLDELDHLRASAKPGR